MWHALPLIEYRRTADEAMASWSNLFFVQWKGETRLDAVRAMREHLTTFAGRHPRSIGVLTIVGPSAPLPSSEVRAAIADTFKSLDAELRAYALVFEGQGFQAAATRGVMTGLALLIRPSSPNKVFSTVEDAARWLAPRLSDRDAPPEASIVSVVRGWRG